MWNRLCLSVVLLFGFRAFWLVRSQETCGKLIKSVLFEGTSRTGTRIPYIESLAYQDWAPYSYLDGFFGDTSTRGNVNDRAVAVLDGESRHLEVKLPEGCVTSACAMQTKSLLLLPVESATLKFKMRFGPNFDWVRGGKLPGLCGGRCLTGCKEVTGLDGWSSRQMWRPCVWPPEHEDNSINCEGGKLVAYVYHMFKQHWCGDDFEFSNDLFAREYSTNRLPVVPKDFFQPKPEEWYTVWSHVKMNTAGSPDAPEKFEKDGVLQTWIEIPGLEPLLVVDKQDMSWRRMEMQTIDFDDFQIWEGKCAPTEEPFDQEVTHPTPVWPNMKTDLNKPTTLLALIAFEKAFVGGGCGDFEIENQADVPCEDYELELNIRPEWGTLMLKGGKPNVRGLTIIDSDAEAGWFLLKPDEGRIEPGMVNSRNGLCVRASRPAKYLPEKLNVHMVAHATCTAGPAASALGKNLNPVTMPDPAPIIVPPSPTPQPAIPPAANDSWCQTTTSEGALWSIFSIVKAMLCSEASSFEKPWSTVDVGAVTCPKGKTAIFPDNSCIDSAAWL